MMKKKKIKYDIYLSTIFQLKYRCNKRNHKHEKFKKNLIQ